jgi:hypothetical protein
MRKTFTIMARNPEGKRSLWISVRGLEDVRFILEIHSERVEWIEVLQNEFYCWAVVRRCEPLGSLKVREIYGQLGEYNFLKDSAS